MTSDQLLETPIMPPAEDMPPVIPPPKKSFFGGKLVATVFGLVLLVGAIAVGTKLVGQKTNYQQKAAYPLYCPDVCTTPGETMNVTTSTQCWVAICRATNDSSCSPYGWYIDHYVSCNPNPTPAPGKCDPGVSCGNGCRKTICPNGDTTPDGMCELNDEGAYIVTYYNAGAGCPGVTCGNQCCQIDFANNGSLCYPSGCNYKEINWNCPTPAPPESTPTPVPSPTPTPVPPVCLLVQAYADDGQNPPQTWIQLSQDQLNALQPGMIINFKVTATPVGTDRIDAAKFIINGSEYAGTRLGTTNEFYYRYTVPTGATTFTATAQLHDAAYPLNGGWF